MTRDLTSEVLAALAPGSRPREALFLQGDFASGILRLWTGLGPIDWDGHTWAGAGDLVAISPIEETNTVTASGVTVSLSGVGTDQVALAIDEARQGAPGHIWLALLDDAGQIIPNPIYLFGGQLDVPQIDDTGDTCRISITYESQLIDLQRPRVRRYTHEDQQITHPGDRGFEFVTTIQTREVQWG